MNATTASGLFKMLDTTAPPLSVLPPPGGKATAISTLVPLSVIGIITNSITISVIATSPKLKSTFNWFILSLAVSDLTSAVISTIFLYRITWGYYEWVWPDFFCSFFWALDIWTSYVTSSHILVFSLLRCISVQWPARFKAMTQFHAKVIIVLIWSCTFIIGSIPFILWFKPMNPDDNLGRPSCSLDLAHEKEFLWYTCFAYSIFFYIPIILITIISITIAIKIAAKRKKRKAMINTNGIVEAKRRRKENQMMLQLGLIVGSFLLGYITYSAYHLTLVTNNDSSINLVGEWWFGFIEYLMLRISECVNPLFYNLASSVMRNETRLMLKTLWKKITCKEEELNSESSRRTESPEDDFDNFE